MSSWWTGHRVPVSAADAVPSWVPNPSKWELFSCVPQPSTATSFRYKPSIRLFFLLWEWLIKSFCLVEALQKLYRKNKQI